MAWTSVRALVDLIYPPRCVVCGGAGAVLCAACLASVHAPREPLCRLCGRSLSEPALDSATCLACAHGHGPAALTALRAAATHEEAIRLAILALKYRGQRRLAEPLGDLLAAAVPALFPAVDLVIPVPLHAARLRQRGYNQSELLARRCAARLGLPCDTQILRRHRATPPQVGLSAPDRRANVHGAFELTSLSRAGHLAGRRVLLVDDVTTTGSTLEAAAAALLPAQPAALYGLAVTRPDLADDVPDARNPSPMRTSARRSRPQ